MSLTVQVLDPPQKEIYYMAGKVNKPMSRFKKILFWGLGCAILLVVIAAFVAGSYLTPNYITKKVEEDLNCRFELGGIDVSLFSPSASLSITGVKMAKRDSFVEDLVAHDERPKLESSEVEIGKVEVKISLLDILFRDLSVQQILIDGAHANVTLNRDGSHSLEKLFASPKEEKKRSKKDKKKTFNIKTNSSLVAKLKKFDISNLSLDLVVEASELNVKVENFNLSLKDELLLDVKDLENMKASNWGLGLDIHLSSGDKQIEYGKLGLSGDFSGILFDPETGDLEPDVEVKLQLGKDSYLKKIPALQKLSDVYLGLKKLPFFKNVGLEEWPETYPFKNHKTIHCTFNENKYEFLSPLAIDVGKWSLQLDPGSWFNTTDVQHHFNYSMYAGPSTSKVIDASCNFLLKALPGSIKKKAQGEIEKLVYDEGRFVLRMQTTGELTSPEVKMNSKLPSVSGMKETLLKDLKSKLKDLF